MQPVTPNLLNFSRSLRYGVLKHRCCGAGSCVECFNLSLCVLQAKCSQLSIVMKHKEVEAEKKSPQSRDRNGQGGGVRRSISTLTDHDGRHHFPPLEHYLPEPEVSAPDEAINFLQSLRILPVQRLPRYVLLLERFVDDDVLLSEEEIVNIKNMVHQVRQVAQQCDSIVNQSSAWRKLYQVQQSITDFRYHIMCSDRVFKHEGMLVALGRDLPNSRGGIGSRSSFDGRIGARGSFDGRARSMSSDVGLLAWWAGRKEREYKIFLFHDILIFCKPTHREKGQQMYEKRGLLEVRRVVDCRREEDKSSWLVFRVYGRIVELHPKLLWTQVSDVLV